MLLQALRSRIIEPVKSLCVAVLKKMALNGQGKGDLFPIIPLLFLLPGLITGSLGYYAGEPIYVEQQQAPSRNIRYVLPRVISPNNDYYENTGNGRYYGGNAASQGSSLNNYPEVVVKSTRRRSYAEPSRSGYRQ